MNLCRGWLETVRVKHATQLSCSGVGSPEDMEVVSIVMLVLLPFGFAVLMGEVFAACLFCSGL